MKKIIIAAALLLLCASLMSCDMINKFFGDDIKLGDKSDNPKTEEQGAVITRVSSDSSSLTVKIENNTDSTWQSGNMRDYSLEAEKDGEWYTVTQIGELANTMELMIFAPGETLTHTFEFRERYGNLTPGKYRIVKSFWANKTATADAHEFHLVCEFTVE
ncbi:MAG: hypothetical protein IJW53_00155 [Clostridia bacterium]|nr:hypothetical protein [Clostridia bacterium]